eukprot:TRINITY_DN5893_c0_g1_i2.p1 TRINITY_DN5893_c0_g1~~TRINITY_DN5893_c0_g1_i2.p1  ORF type:complete len:350 (-),score=64.26 TRINITY_DN5893_c0_g1_i2:136-1122(-)
MIDEEIRQAAIQKSKEIKLLLLGAGESGKSTIAKQLKIIHQSGYSRDELRAHTLPVLANCLTALKVVVGVTQRDQELSKRAKKVAKEIQFLSEVTVTTGQELKDKLPHLFNDPAIKKTIDNLVNYRAPDSAAYFLKNLDRIFAEGFVPTVEDVLRARIKTSGVYETRFQNDNSSWILVDVGGQRHERRKWIRCFDGVTAVLFCVALNEYDLGLEEDNRVNRMHESLKLFEETCNSAFFNDASIILFLNKDDLFREKIQRVDLNVCFEEYTGGKNYEKALKFIRGEFKSSKRKVYTHVSVATDTENIQFIFKAVLDTILSNESKRGWQV